MKDMIYREDAVKAIEHVMLDAYGHGVEEAPAIEYRATYALRQLPSARYTSYEQPAPSKPTIMEALKCTCGSSIVCHTTVDIGVDTTVEELYCPECGIIMRAPHGMLDMLMKNWRDVHMKVTPVNRPLTFHEAKQRNEDREPLYVECSLPISEECSPLIFLHENWVVGIGWFRRTTPEEEPSGPIEEAYGSKWRCWARKPTDAEREAALWKN